VQQTFDFGRGDQLGLLDAARIPSRRVGTARVSAAAMRHVLRVIDSHGRGREAWPGLQTIARETSLGVRTVKRAVAALADMSLLVITKRRPATGLVPVNHYRIVWSELALLVPTRPGLLAPTATPRNCGPDHGATGPEHGATITDHGATMARAWGHHGTQSVKETPIRKPPPPSERKEEEVFLDDLISDYVTAGVYAAAARVRTAVGQTDLAHVRGLLDHYQAAGGAWGPGALALRLTRATPGLAVDAGWPPAQRTAPPELQAAATTKRLAHEKELLRSRIVKAGRLAGATEEQIAAKCTAAGVDL